MFVFSNANKKGENVNGEEGEIQKLKMTFFRERMSSFSLEYRAIRLSAVFGTRRKAALRGETYAWVPDLRSFDKLREVGVSPYLGFTLCLSVFTMFELIEAVSGRLIGPKSWDLIVGNFWRGFVQSMDCLVILCDQLCINS